MAEVVELLKVRQAFDSALAAHRGGDHGTALRLFRTLAEQGLAQAQYNLGLLCHEGHGGPRDYAEAALWYRKAAEQGVALAQTGLGLLYDEGLGVPQDYAEAAKWYRLAADQGVALAQTGLAFMYARGDGVIQDDRLAQTWLRRAAAIAPSSAGPSPSLGLSALAIGARQQPTRRRAAGRRGMQPGH